MTKKRHAVHNRNKAFVLAPYVITRQHSASEAAQRTASLRTMEARDRAKLIRLPDVPFLKRRLPGEPDSGRWV